MLPDVNEVVVAAVADETFPDSGLPVAEILVLAGFLLIYLVEELMHFVLVKYGNLGRPDLSQSGHSVTLSIFQKTRRLRSRMVVTVTPMTMSSSQQNRDFRSSVDSGEWGHQPAIHYCKNI